MEVRPTNGGIVSTKNEQEAKKRRTSDVYSNTYDNGGWSERDALPTGDPIGDVDEKQDPYKQFEKDQKKYMDEMKTRVMFPASKNFEVNPKDFLGLPEMKTCCEKPDKYKNIISTSLKFWSCRNCGSDLGDIND